MIFTFTKVNNFLASRLNQYFLPILILLGIYAYWPIHTSGFLPWDDPAYVIENNDVHSFSVFRFFKETYLGNYHPFTMLLYGLIYKLKGPNPGFYHFTSLMLHFFNSVLVYAVSKRFITNNKLAILIGAVFFLHPAQVESVAWVAELKNVLFAFFFLLSLIQYLNFIESSANKYFIYSLLFFICALLSKGQAVSLAICAPAMGLWLRPEIHWKKHLQYALTLILVAIIFGSIAIWAQGNDGYINARHENSFVEKIGLASFLYSLYHLKIVFPYPLEAFYPFPKSIPFYYYFFILIPVLVTILTFRLFKKKDFASVSFIFCVGSLLLPILQFIPVGEAVMADRYSYLVIFFLFLFLFAKFSSNEKTVFILGVFILIPFSFYTNYRAKIFSTEKSFLNALISRYPDNDVVLNSYGAMLMGEKKLQEAKPYLLRAAKSDSLYFQAWSNLGQVYNLLNQSDSAIIAYQKSLKAEPTFYPASYGLAIGLESLGQNEEALTSINAALKYEPNNAHYLYLKGLILSKLSQDAEAVKLYTASIKYGFSGENIWINRAVSMGRLGDFNSALNDLQQAIRINPKSSYAWYLCGMAKIKLNKNGCNELQESKSLGYPAQEAIQEFCNL